MIDFIDLFSGIGGFRLGLERVGGFQCVWSCDWFRSANQIYFRRFKPEKGTHFTGDIRKVKTDSIPDHTLLTAGFPCQTFSSLGKRKGFEETCGTLFYEIAQVARAKRPTLLLLENVEGLLNHNAGQTFRTILEVLGNIGYRCEWQVLYSYWFGPPQIRPRVYLLASLRESNFPPIFPITESPKGNIKTIEAEHCKPIIFPTVTTGFGSKACNNQAYIIETEGVRYLTFNEIETLQGFPKGWTEGISGGDRYRVLGNAVTVNVIEHLGELIMSSFTNIGEKDE